jgi:hypothetical protein
LSPPREITAHSAENPPDFSKLYEFSTSYLAEVLANFPENGPPDEAPPEDEG